MDDQLNFECVRCGTLIAKWMVSDPSTCDKCQIQIAGDMDLKKWEKAEYRRLKPLVKLARHPISFDYSEDNRSYFYELIPCDTADPLQILMAKERWEEENRWKHVTRRVQYAEPIDIKQAHIDKLAATAPYRNIRSKRIHSVISKQSPERGITQRHIKMSPLQFV